MKTPDTGAAKKVKKNYSCNINLIKYNICSINRKAITLKKETHMDKIAWEKAAKERTDHYLNLNDGGFDETMKAHFYECDFEEKSLTIEFETQKWQINERGGIHGGAIAGMFDTAFGIMANFIAGEKEAATVDMTVNFLRPLELGETCRIKVITVKAGRSIIRLRAEAFCVETGKQTAAGSGSWMPL